MMTALAERKGAAEGALALRLSSEEQNLIRSEICRGATDSEIKLFLYKCQALGVNPLRGQAHLVEMNEKDGDGWIKKRAFIMGVEGFAARAAQHEDYLGCEAFAVCDGDEFLFDAVLGIPAKHLIGVKRGAPIGAWARVRRAGERKDISVHVRFCDYVRTRKDQSGKDVPMRNWATMPAVMIEKVARATALRRAYPETFSGVFSPEERGVELIEEVDTKVIAPPSDSTLIAPGHIAALCAAWGEYAKNCLHLTGKDIEEVRDSYLREMYGVESKKDLTIEQFKKFMAMLEAGEIHHEKREAAKTAPKVIDAVPVTPAPAKVAPPVAAPTNGNPAKRKPLF